jgi:hypothetical protein
LTRQQNPGKLLMSSARNHGQRGGGGDKERNQTISQANMTSQAN